MHDERSGKALQGHHRMRGSRVGIRGSGVLGLLAGRFPLVVVAIDGWKLLVGGHGGSGVDCCYCWLSIGWWWGPNCVTKRQQRMNAPIAQFEPQLVASVTQLAGGVSSV